MLENPTKLRKSTTPADDLDISMRGVATRAVSGVLNGQVRSARGTVDDIALVGRDYQTRALPNHIYTRDYRVDLYNRFVC